MSEATIASLFGGENMIVVERLENGEWHLCGEQVFNSVEDAYNWMQSQPDTVNLRWRIL